MYDVCSTLAVVRHSSWTNVKNWFENGQFMSHYDDEMHLITHEYTLKMDEMFWMGNCVYVSFSEYLSLNGCLHF